MTWVDFRDEERFKREYKTLCKSKVKRRKITKFIHARLNELEELAQEGRATYKHSMEYSILRPYEWKSRYIFLEVSTSYTSFLRERKAAGLTGWKKWITRLTYEPDVYEQEKFQRDMSREVVDELVAQLKAL